MKIRSGLTLLMSVMVGALGPTAATAGGPSYDLTGTWRLMALDVQLSFCDGSSSQEVVNGVAVITQSGELLTLTLLDPPNNQVFQGRTSSFFVGAEMSTADQTTVLSGTVTPSANRINGSLLFFDKNPCPDAETGSARFALTRIN